MTILTLVEETGNNILYKQEPLGDLDFKSMVPEAIFAALMILIMLFAIFGMSTAFRTHDPKRAIAVGILTGAAVILCILGLITLQGMI